MAIKDKVFKGKIKQSANFNFKEIYSFIYDYMSDEDWEMHETLYKERTVGDGVKEVNIKWTASKKVSSYFKMEITFFWIILGMKDVKVVIDGKEEKIQNGTLEINIDSTLIKDYQNKWKDGFMKTLREIYDNSIIADRIYDYEAYLFEKTNEMIATIKSYLAIEGQHQY